MLEPDLLVDYAPRAQFEGFHVRTQRFACIVTHRRAGKTVACVEDLQHAAMWCTQASIASTIRSTALSEAGFTAGLFVGRNFSKQVEPALLYDANRPPRS